MMAESVVLSSCTLYFILFQILPPAVCGLQFNSPFNGNKLTGVLGSSLNFTWAFHGGNTDRIEWGTKRDSSVTIKEVLVSIDKLQTITTIQNPPYTGRVSGDWDGSSPGQVTFTLNSIQKADERFYSCKLSPESLGAQSVYDTVQLIVVEIPVISPPSINGSYIEGSSVNISCTATGKPDPEVSWIRNGQTKSSGRSTAYLNFNQIKRTDDGLYTCTAKNSAGTKSHEEILVIRYAAKILSVNSSAAKSWIGQTVTLKCMADGVPTPTLTWYKPDGIEINTVTAKESKVKVTIIDDQDFGKYKCSAYNGLDPLNDASVAMLQIRKSNDLCPTDVAFILDSSNSIKDEDFNDEKEIVKKLVMNLDIAPNKNRAALVRFSTSPLLVARFGEYETAYKFQDVIEKLPKMGKRTRIDIALNLAENQIFPEARKGVNKMTIILTDGVQSTGAQGLRPSSKPLRDAGVRVIAVGVGVGKRERRLRLMTDRDEDVVDLKDVQRRLQEILDDISQNGCNQLPKPPAQKKCEDESVYEHECKKNINIKSKNFCRDHPDFSFIHCQKSCDLCPLL